MTNNEVTALDRIRKAIEDGTGSLPEVDASDNGKVLTVVSGGWNKANPSGGGSLVVHVNTSGETPTLDKKAGEIFIAYTEGKNVVCVVTDPAGTTSCFNLISANHKSDENYSFEFKTPSERVFFNAESADAYPSMGMEILDNLEVEFEDDGEGNIVGDVEASRIYSAFDNGVPVNFYMHEEGQVIVRRVVVALREDEGSYFFYVPSDTSAYPLFEFEASDGDSYPVLVSQG